MQLACEGLIPTLGINGKIVILRVFITAVFGAIWPIWPVSRGRNCSPTIGSMAHPTHTCRSWCTNSSIEICLKTFIWIASAKIENVVLDYKLVVVVVFNWFTSYYITYWSVSSLSLNSRKCDPHDRSRPYGPYDQYSTYGLCAKKADLNTPNAKRYLPLQKTVTRDTYRL